MVIYLTREQRRERRRQVNPPQVEHYDENGTPIAVVSPSVEVDVPTEQVEVKPAKKRTNKSKKKEAGDEV